MEKSKQTKTLGGIQTWVFLKLSQWLQIENHCSKLCFSPSQNLKAVGTWRQSAPRGLGAPSGCSRTACFSRDQHGRGARSPLQGPCKSVTNTYQPLARFDPTWFWPYGLTLESSVYKSMALLHRVISHFVQSLPWSYEIGTDAKST